MMSSLQGGRLFRKVLGRLTKENYSQLLYDDKVLCASLFMNIRNVHPQINMALHTNNRKPTSTIIENNIKLSTSLIVRQVTNTTESSPPLKKAGILRKILKISLGSVIALLTTGGLLIAKNIYEDEEDPVSPEDMTAPGRRSDINKEWVEFMLTNFENRQKPGTKVMVNTFEIGDATQKGDGYAGDHVKLLVNATIQTDAAVEEESALIYDKDYNLFIKLLNPHPFMQQMMKYITADLNELLFYSNIMDDFQKYQVSKTNEKVCFNTPTFIYGKWTNKQFVLVLENMKAHGYGQNPKEKSFNLHQAKLGLEQFARLHAVSYAYHKEHNILNKYPSYNGDALMDLLTVGYEKLLDSCIVFLKGREGTEEIIKKMLSTKSNLVKKACEVIHYDTQIKSLVHADCWNNNFLFKADIDENGHQTFINSEKMLVLDFQGLHWNTPIFDLCMFIYRNTTPQFRKKHLEELIIYYHSTFTDILTKLNCEESSWTYEQFKSEFDRVFPWHLQFALDSAILQSEAMKEMSLGKTDPGPSGPMWTKIKTAVAKLVIPLFMHPVTCELLTDGLMQPFTKELIEDKNKLFCDLMFNVLLEAEENGIFDESKY